MDSIPSPSPSVKIQIVGGKSVKANIAIVNKLLLTIPSNVLPLNLKQTFSPIIWIFTEDEGDEIESKLPFKIFSTLYFCKNIFNISILFLFKVAEVAGYMTPVPGGVGPCTVACLLYNTVIAAKRLNLEPKLSQPN